MHQKIVLITGGSRGLGKSAALMLAKQGVDVVLTYQSRRDDAIAVVDEIAALGRKAIALPLDVGQIGTFGVFVEQLQAGLDQTWQRGDVDFLVNNAGIGVHAPFADTDEAQFDLLMNVHFKGVFF